jgi:C-terminal processing protease CtpA/Prc
LDWPEGETIPALEGDSLRRGSVVEGSVESFLPKVFNARAVTTGSGTFAYIRIRTFSVDNAFRFVLEFIRLAALLPQNGLIIDVRDNGGGLIMAGEMLLQTLTPKRIEPEPLQFVNTAETRALIEHHSGSNRPYEDFDLTPWRKSARYATKTGATYTRGFPITSPFLANFLGQRYHGPVVLITNGRCYSTTDIFAAGFQDHEIGQIIGTDGNTGAGGANVWRHSLLRDLFDGVPANPIKDLPQGVGMRVSARRTIRVSGESGTPLEDLGVIPDILHFMTRKDLLERNVDLIEHAGELLGGKTVYVLNVISRRIDGDDLELEIRTQNLDRLDTYLDERPQRTDDIGDGTSTIRIPTPGNDSVVDLKGFKNGQLKAARRLLF